MILNKDFKEFIGLLEKHEVFQDESGTIKFIGLQDLIKNKKSTGRLQDLADVEMLERVNRDSEDQ
ncbi:MAG: hypothetical protein NXI25_10235 [bacterium]|nr:hypothetical protein [bacterium]